MTSQVMRVGFSLLAMALITGNTAFSQETIHTPQSWVGTLEVGTAKLHLRFDIEKDDAGNLKCTMVNIDQGKAKIPMDSCTIEAGKLVITSKKLKIVYEGSYKNRNAQIAGKFTQAGRSFDLTLKPTKPLKPTKHIETWQGTLNAGGRSFEIQFRILETTDKKRTVELDSFSESIRGVHVDPTFNDDGVTFVVLSAKARFEGKYNKDKTQIDGHWLQGGGKFPLTIKQVPLANTRSIKHPKRPQTPKKPLGYHSAEVTFKNTDAKITLSGTLTTPNNKGPFAAVVLITGSGPQDRDESIVGHKPFLVLADHLTKAGIAVLRYDDRGVGKSTGNYPVATSEDLSHDVDAAIEFLKTRHEIDAKRIGLIGHSEGGLIAPMIAARRDDVGFIVMLAGPGVPGDQIVLNQTEKVGRAEGGSSSDIDLRRRFQKVMFRAVRSARFAGNNKDIKTAIVKTFDEFMATLSDEEKKSRVAKSFRAAVSSMMDPWMFFFLTYDPRPALQKVKCPVLVLNGKKDLQVDPQLNLPEIRKALKTGGNTQFEIQELPGLNHLFQTCRTGSPSEYRQIEETFSPVALDIISKWINGRTE